jgi:hypothetical protein
MIIINIINEWSNENFDDWWCVVAFLLAASVRSKMVTIIVHD